VLGATACSTQSSGFTDVYWGGDDGGNAPADDAGSGTDSRAPASDGGGGSTVDTGSGNPGDQDGSVADSGAPDSSPAQGMDSGSGTITSADGFAASRQACINKINALRATDTAVKLQPYTLMNTDALNSCVDTQSSTDQSKNSAHWSFINNSPSCTWGNATGFAQNECEQGYGTTPAGIEQCLQDMWDESLKPNCLGCVGCTAFGGACPNCDYSGSMGYECGHYVNMSAPYFTQVVCGFAGAAPSSADGWSDQNFE
jgi:hypothetical protein